MHKSQHTAKKAWNFRSSPDSDMDLCTICKSFLCVQALPPLDGKNNALARIPGLFIEQLNS